ncbi:MAG TPA: aldehyde ferredoxin oxidoreductase [Clostridiales bacterium]|nr:aldehyde ferredoxin oxidoreductase [Clostridiales bacterium]
MNSGGYMGRVAWVDLTRRSVEVKALDTGLAEKYIGGSGLGAKILYDTTDGRTTDPLGPDNVIIFATGPLTGTPAPLSGRHEIIAKSPLTGIYGESDCGGMWGTALKRAGLDAVVVRGASAMPVYLWINEGQVTIRNAHHVWGMDTYAMDPVLKGETDPKAVVTGIGPAGERLVPLAAVMSDGKDGRAAGRCGLGAVMGSKRLKALVAHGTAKPAVANPSALTESIRTRGAAIREAAKGTTDYGTGGFMATSNSLGDLPIKNWVEGEWTAGAQKLSGQRMAETILVDRYGCGACFISCGRTVKVGSGPFAPVDGAGPEYETLATIGASCLLDDLEAVARANELCNRLGLDTISTGAVIAFGMEAVEKGLLSRTDAGEVDLRWGSADGVLRAIEAIAYRRGIGDFLAGGVRRMGTVLGPEADALAVHVKGLELPAHDPRCFASKAVSYATSNRGACHLQSGSHFFELGITDPALGVHAGLDRFATEGKGALVARCQNAICMWDSLKVCKFLPFGGGQLGDILSWFNAVTGRDLTMDAFLATGERIFNLKRLYNLECGITGHDDTLPPRMFVPKKTGGSAGYVPDLKTMLDEYYHARGWTADGRPTPATLRRLDLVAD